jgi:2,4-dienoyl-CoA reductase-like NADH-dependent reductase (Old Yellow Enzyme family)
MASKLFTPITLAGLELRNRIVVAPMCQYSAHEGCATDWHLMHLGQFSVSGVGLLIMEMTNVQENGRITPYCMGLYNDENERALAKVLEFIGRYGSTPFCIQLAHAGRKASTAPPWDGRAGLTPEQGGWETVAPSALAFSDDYIVPRALETEEVSALVEDFAAAATRSDRLGIDAIELHGAHGYLMHQFLSPLSNQRQDQYGGSLENRMRLPLAVFDAVREVWPAHKPLGFRVSATDGADGGWDVAQTIEFAKALKARGCDWIDVSSGGLVEHQSIKPGPGYQVPFASEIRAASGLPTMAVGMITEARQAEQILSGGHADMIALGLTRLSYTVRMGI